MSGSKNSLWKRIASAVLGFTMVFGTAAATVPVLAGTGTVTAAAASAVTVNAANVTLYGMNDWADEFISIPSNYAQSFQLKVTGASKVTYSASNNYVTVSSNGLIQPHYTTTYWYPNGSWSVGYSYPLEGKTPSHIDKRLTFGTTKITICADGQYYYVNVKLEDYTDVYANKVMDDYLKANINSSMTTREKIVKIAQFICARNYSPYYSSAVGLIVSGGADCWGSTDAAVTMAEKIGLDAWSRNGNRDYGAGSGHMNAIITDGKEYYELEAGYSGNAPRGYSLTKRTSLFSYRTSSKASGIEVYQYDGKTMPEVLTVPSSIDGKTVVGIGQKFIEMKKGVKEVKLPNTIQYIGKSAFNSCYDLQKINFPASLTEIADFVFTDCRALTTISISGTAFKFVNGVLYKGTTLLYCPNKENVSILSGTKEIAPYSFYYNGSLKSVVIPASVETIGEGAFGDCGKLSAMTINSTKITSIPSYAMIYTALPYVVLPDSVTQISEKAFDRNGGNDKLMIVGKAGGAAETYAKANNHPFLDASKAVKNTSTLSSASAVVGDKVTVYAKASGGKAPYTYEVYYKYQYDSGFSGNLLLGSATSAAFPITTAGNYGVKVIITDGYGMKAEKSFNVVSKAALSCKATLSANTVSLGQSVTVSAEASGGYSSYCYALEYKSSTDTAWQSAAAFGSSASMTFKPTKTDTYSLRVTVKDTKNKTAYAYLTLSVTAPALTNTSTASASLITQGSTLTVTGSGTGGSGNYQYALWYKKSGDTSWTSVRAYSTAPKMTFTPKEAVSYSVCAAVKDSNKKVAYKYFNLTVNPPALKNNSTILASSITIGATVTVTGAASDGYGGYQYALHYKSSSDSSWQSAAALSTTAKMTFKPAKVDTYSVRVTVKDAKKKTAYKYFTLTVNPPALKNNSTLSASSVTLGAAITVTGAASGGYGGYRYALQYKSSSDSSWQSAAALSTTAKMTFKPAKAATYSLRVTVKDSKNKTVYKYFTLTVNPKPLVNNSKLSASSIQLGSTVTVTGSASGGVGSYRYSLEYKAPGDTSRKSAAALSTAAKMTFKPAQKGTYVLCITVKDTRNTVCCKYVNLVVNG